MIANVAEASEEDIDRAVAAARRAFDYGPWPRMSGRARGRVMQKFADLLEKHKEELAGLESLDNGITYACTSGAHVPLTIDHIRYFATWADKRYGEAAIFRPASKEMCIAGGTQS